jgi:hypothetical protein
MGHHQATLDSSWADHCRYMKMKPQFNRMLKYNKILYRGGGTCYVYRTHHSVCDTVLFTTPRVVITIFLYNQFWPPDVLSRGGPLMSSPSEGWQLTGWLLVVTGNLSTICDSLQAVEIHVLKRAENRTPCPTVYLPSQQFRCVGNNSWQYFSTRRRVFILR